MELEKGLSGLGAGCPVPVGREWRQQSQARGRRTGNSGDEHKWVLYHREREKSSLL